VAFLLIQSYHLFSQVNVDTAYSFIDKYAKLAVQEYNESGVPASVTLAQAIYESGCGSSYLATFGNNFFGIKCHKGWVGDSLIQDDETHNECFRSYDSPGISFADHSKFLKTRSRYQFLFCIPVSNYQAWCDGLQTAGYATDKKYASTLIYIIKKYRLYQLDQAEKLVMKPIEYETHELEGDDWFLTEDQLSSVRSTIKDVVSKNYHIADKGQSIRDISKLYGMDVQLLCTNNNVSQKQVFKGGEILFLTKKKTYKYQLPVNQ
jgi:hypothetical protein